MPKFEFSQAIGQLEKRKGGYFYFKIDADIVHQFDKKRSTRLICKMDQKVEFQCGLNHLGDGNFFIIVSTKNLKALGKQLGDEIHFSIEEDPNPLGVEIPEVLSVLLEQDEVLKGIWNRLTDGKKRSVIYGINKIKNVDLQVEKSIVFLNQLAEDMEKKARKKQQT